MIERDKNLTVRADSRDAAARWFAENYGIDDEPVPCGMGLWSVPVPGNQCRHERRGYTAVARQATATTLDVTCLDCRETRRCVGYGEPSVELEQRIEREAFPSPAVRDYAAREGIDLEATMAAEAFR